MITNKYFFKLECGCLCQMKQQYYKPLHHYFIDKVLERCGKTGTNSIKADFCWIEIVEKKYNSEFKNFSFSSTLIPSTIETIKYICKEI